MLVRPFIQPINAFDATTNKGVATIGILGGNKIQRIIYEIYQGTNNIYRGLISVTDNGGDEIRTFNISLTSSLGIVNNVSYTIRAYTVSSLSGATEFSGYSSLQYFSCYTTPTITIKDVNGTTLDETYTFSSQLGTLYVNFDKVSSESPAMLNNIEVYIYGRNGSKKDLIFDSGVVYAPFSVEYDNLLPTDTTSSIYNSYTLEWIAYTVQNMEIKGVINALKCHYQINGSASMISVNNDAPNGRIVVSFSTERSYRNIDIPFGANTISAVTQDSDNVYIVGGTGTFAIYDKGTKTVSQRIATPFSARIEAIDCDEKNVYMIDHNGDLTVYNKSSQSFNGKTASGLVVPSTMCNDENSVYCSSLGGGFVVYDKESATFGSAIPNDFSSIYDIANGNGVVYCGGDSGYFAIYNKISQSFGEMIPTPFGGGTAINAITVAGNKVFCVGDNGKFAYYDIDNQVFSALIDISSADLKCVASDKNYVYIGTSEGNVEIYNIYENSIETTDQTGMDSVQVISVDENNIFVAYSTTFKAGQEDGAIIRRKQVDGNESYYTLVSKDSGELPIGGESCVFYDYFAKTNALYEYEIISGSNVETVQVLSQFYGVYIADGEQSFEITTEWSRDAISQVQKSVAYEPYGSKFPIIAYNAVTNYRSGTDSCIVWNSQNEQRRDSDYIDRAYISEIQKKANQFFTNRKPKVLKDYNGNIILVNVLDIVANSVVKELGNTIVTTQFNWVEVGEFTETDIQKLGIKNSFKIISGNAISTPTIGEKSLIGQLIDKSIVIITEADVSGITQIGDYAFYTCTNLVGVPIPSAVTTIGTSAFYACRNIENISLPSSITTIRDDAFLFCSRLTGVYYGGDISTWSAIDFGNVNSNPLLYAGNLYINNQRVETINIPNTITYIKQYSFAGWNGEDVTLPYGIRSIEEGAFYNCRGLSSINIIAGVESIGSLDMPPEYTYGAFENCSSLRTIFIPRSVYSIGANSFKRCTSLVHVSIEDGIQFIDVGAFQFCTSLQDITIFATVPPDLGDDTVFAVTQGCPIYVPSDSVQDYKTADIWSTYADRISAMP